jgi:hypothetical protein
MGLKRVWERSYVARRFGEMPWVSARRAHETKDRAERLTYRSVVGVACRIDKTMRTEASFWPSIRSGSGPSSRFGDR